MPAALCRRFSPTHSRLSAVRAALQAVRPRPPFPAACPPRPRTASPSRLLSLLTALPLLTSPSAGKCRGLRTARKLRSHRRDQKWHDKQYKKAHLGTALKANPFGGASHAKGIVLEKVWVLLPSGLRGPKPLGCIP